MPELPATLKLQLDRYAACRRRWKLLRAAAETALALLCGVLLVALVDAIFRPERDSQIAGGWLAYAAAFLVLAWRGLWPVLRRRRMVDVALSLEESTGGRMQERVSSAVELAGSPPAGVSSWMVNRTISLAVAEVTGLQPTTVVDRTPALRAWKRAAVPAALACLALAVPAARTFLLRALLPGINLARPFGAKLTVEPGNARLAAGNSLEVRLRTRPVEDRAVLAIEWEDGLSEELTMKPLEKAGAFRLLLPELMQGFSYRVKSGSAESRFYRVSVVDPPRVSEVSLRIVPPAYVGDRVKEVSGGDAELLAGSVVEIRAEFTGPKAVTAEILHGSGERKAMRLSGKQAAGRLKVLKSLRYRLHLTAEDGLVADSAQQWSLTVVPDRKPVVTLSGVGLKAGLAGLKEHLVLEVSAGDDWGLSRCELLMKVDNGPEEKAVRFALRDEKSLEMKRLAALDIEALGLREGGNISLVLSATDLGGHTARSEPLTLTVTDGAPAGTAAVAARLRKILERMRGAEKSLAAERRTWSELARSFRREDPEAQRGTLVVARQRLASAFKAVGELGGQIKDEASRLEPKMGAAVFRFGSAVEGWAANRGAVTLRIASQDNEKKDSKAPAASSPLSTALELVVTSARELGETRRSLGLVVARVEAEGMVMQAEAAGGRQGRTVPVLEGYYGWKRLELQKQPGLLARFYAGRQLAGAPVHSAAGAVNMTNFRVPGTGPQNWSVRYSGEVRVAKSGKWTFACRADDGVRLWVAGKELIGSKAWIDQSPTSYSGQIDLQAGWHPVEIRMFQGTQGSHLSFHRAFGKDRAKLVPVGDLRHLPVDAASRSALVRKMASLPEGLLRNAHSRLRRDCSFLVGVPATIRQMDRDAGVRGLESIARAADGPAGGLLAALAKTDGAGWERVRLDEVSVKSGEVVTRARQARDLVARAFAYALDPRRHPAGLTGDLQRSIARVKHRAEGLLTLGKGRQESERREMVARSIETMRAELGQLRGSVSSARREFWKRAADPRRDLGERQRAFLAGKRLGDEVADALEKIEPLLARGGTKPEDVTKLVSAARGQLGAARLQVQNAASEEGRAQASRASRMARRALTEAAAADEKRGADDALAREEARQRFAAMVSALAKEQKKAGNFASARALEEGLAGARKGEMASALKNALYTISRKDYKQDWRVGNALEKEAGRIETRKPSGFEVAERLKGSALQVELTAESQVRRGRYEEAAAYRKVRDELEGLARRKKAARAGEVRALAGRIAAIESRLGKDARDKAIAEGEEHEKKRAATDERVAHARKLEGLSKEALGAAHKQSQREGFREKLEKLARTSAERGELAGRKEAAAAAALGQMARATEGSAEQLKELGRRLDQLDEKDARARAAFADAEKRIAEALGKLKDEARGSSRVFSRKPLGKALAEVARKLPERAGKIDELGRSAAPPGLTAQRPERSGKDDSDPAKQLRERARQALTLAEGAAKAAREARGRVGEAQAEGRKAEDLTRKAERARSKASGEDSAKAARDVAALREALGAKPRRDAARALREVSDQAGRASAAAQDAREAADRAGELAGIEARAESLQRALRDAGEQARRGTRDRAATENKFKAAANRAGEMERAAKRLSRKSGEAEDRAKDRAMKLAALAAKPGKTAEEAEKLKRDAAETGRQLAAARKDRELAKGAMRLSAEARRALGHMRKTADSRKEPGDRKRPPPAAAFAEAAARKAEELGRRVELARFAAEARKVRKLQEKTEVLGKLAGTADALAESEKRKRKSPAAEPAAAVAESARKADKAVKAQLAETMKDFAERARRHAALRHAAELARASDQEAKRAEAAAREAAAAARSSEQDAKKARDHANIPERSEGPLARGMRKAEEAGRRAGMAAQLAARAAEALKGGKAAPEKQTAAAAMREWQAARDLAARAADAAKGTGDEAKRAETRAKAKAGEATAAAYAAQQASGAAGRAKRGKEKEEAERKAAQARRAALAKEVEAGKAQAEAQAARDAAGAAKSSAAGAAKAVAEQGKQLAAKASGAAGAGGKPSGPKMSNRQLAEAASREAKALEKEVSAPLADAFKAGEFKAAEKKKAQAVGKLGGKLAQLVAAQKEAADQLGRNQEAREKLQQKLAEKLDDAVGRAERASEVLAGGQAEAATPLGTEADKDAAGLQTQAQAAQRAADAAQQAADRAWGRARALQAKKAAATGNAQQQAALAKQAESAFSNAQTAQQKAVVVQSAALAKQVGAIKAEKQQMAMLTAGSSQAQLAAAQAISNLGRAEANSSGALQNLQRSKEGKSAGTVVQAERNRQQARLAREQLARAQQAAGQALQGKLESLAASARSAQGAAQAQAEMSAQTPGGEPGNPAGEPSPSPSAQAARSARGQAAQAVQKALGAVSASPESTSGYQQAAKQLAEAAQRLQAAASPLASQGQQSSQPGQIAAATSSNSGKGSSGDKDPGDLSGFDRSEKGKDDADWARLADRMRKRIRSGGLEAFAEEHQDAIRAYFRKLGELEK